MGGVSSGAMAEYVFEQPNEVSDYWSFSDVELARSCLVVADCRTGPTDAMARAEAMRVFLLWRDTLQSASPTMEEKEQKVVLLRGLRKRTIQILVRLSLQGYLLIP